MSFISVDRPTSNAQRAGKMRGIWLAIAVDNKDGGDNPGFRVKVKYPWMNDTESSFWARIAVPMAGNDRGAYMLPEIDDQLLVVFEHGDIHRPIIIGAVWNSQQQPVENNTSGKNNTKLIKSRAGHRVIFDDKDGAEKVTIVDKTKKNKFVLDSANKVVTIESAGDIEVKAKQNVIMHSQTLTIGTSQTLTGSGQQVLCHAAQTFGLKATSKITVNGSQVQINISSSPACQVSGSGAGSLEGVEAETAPDQVDAQARGGGGSAGAGAAPGQPGAGSTGSQQPNQDQPPPPKPDAFAIWVAVDAVNGGKMPGESVSIIDPDTGQSVASAWIDDDSNIYADVPENKPYHIVIDSDADVAGASPMAREDLFSSHIIATLYNSLGVAVPAGTVVKISGNGQSHEAKTDGHGAIEVGLPPGTYDLEVGGEKFRADTLRGVDLKHDSGGPYVLKLAQDPPEPDYDAIERGRHQRVTAGDLDDFDDVALR